jgi:integrative and conjugative element protein (TIGR02256 family)
MQRMQPRCWIRRVAVEDILTEARRWRLRETGGALLGWHEEGAYVVDRVLGPGPRAKHGFASFEPDAEWQGQEGARIYRESRRTVAYLGDWHTHPRGKPYPSSQDSQTAKQIAEDTDFRISRPLYAVLGRTFWDIAGRRWRLKLFVDRRKTRRDRGPGTLTRERAAPEKVAERAGAV